MVHVVVMVVMMVVMVVMMHFMRHRCGVGRLGGVFSERGAAKADGEGGGGEYGLDHGKAVLLLIGPQWAIGTHFAAACLNSK